MSKRMYDSVSPGLIPLDAPVVAGYADGLYQWSSADWARFPTAIKISIACFPSSSADILDVEAGCAAPAEVPGWLDRYTRPVFTIPTVYVNRSNWDAVRSAVGSRVVDYWVAIPGATAVPDGAVAVQFDYPGPYDVSMCQDYWPRVPMTPEQDALLRAVFNLLAYGATGAPYNVPAVFAGKLDALKTQIANLQVPPANLQPVLDAVAALKADLDGLTLKKA